MPLDDNHHDHPHAHDAPSTDTPRPLPEYWRSSADLAGEVDAVAWAQREFPSVMLGRSEPPASQNTRHGFTRRQFLEAMATTLALAGLTTATGCRREESRVVAYHKKPPEVTPGVALYYATTLLIAGSPVGVLAETHEGRPTKLEGNPLHPLSRGALDAFAQASILDLYDPDRSRFVTHLNKPARYDEDFLPALDTLIAKHRAAQGKGLALLTGPSASPAFDMLVEELRRAMPSAAVYTHDPLQPSGAPPVEARYDLSRAKVVLALDADVLGLEDAGVKHRRDFADGRTVSKPGDAMNRLYTVEPHWTTTGMTADHRLRLPASRVGDYAAALAAALGVADAPAALPAGIDERWLTAVADDLKANAGACVVVPGRRQPTHVHQLAALINTQLNNTGKTVTYRARDTRPNITALAQAIDAGGVETLVILDVNAVYDAPAGLSFAERLAKVGTTIHLGYYRDETARACTWHLPRAHELESWGDARVGEALCAQQPMIDPLFAGKTALELVARLAGYRIDDTPVFDAYEIVRASFRRLTGEAHYPARWRKFLHEGVATLAPTATASDDVTWPGAAAPSGADSAGLEVCFAPSGATLDGRYANNGWLLECPDPVTKLVWDNAAVVSPRTAKENGLEHGDVVRITADGRSVELPVFIVPGTADGVVALTLGFGRTAAGSLGNRAGFDVYPLRGEQAQGDFVTGATLENTGKKHPLATTQEHWAIEQHEMIDGQLAQRAIVREGTLEEFNDEPEFAKSMGVYIPHGENVHDTPALDAEHQWAMSIDLTKCVGCNACVVACQSENNIPIVGKDEVIHGREMHWMRIDRYFRGQDPLGDVQVAHQPMMCQHCENAPCEPVCPVNATVHSEEGLNVMVYNRCIGTRYCSNNCPYKARRFNFYDYNKDTLREPGMSDAQFDGDPSPDPTGGFSLPQLFQPKPAELLKMQKNPDVTVRMRGVMEKCTFCVQRLERAKIDTLVEAGQTRAKKVADGAVLTACQQSCPTQAIVFGDKSDPHSRVSRAIAQGRDYAVLGHLNTRPRTTYLARLRNVNPAMPAVAVPPTIRQNSKKSKTGSGHGDAAHGEHGAGH